MSECQDKASIMAGASMAAQFSIVFLVIPVAVALVWWLIRLANPKLSDPIQTVPLAQDASEQVPNTPPPAYQQRSDSDDPSTYSDVRWGSRETLGNLQTNGDAEKFVLASAILAVNVFILVIVALSIQGLTWCDSAPTWITAILWVNYTGFCLFQLRGLGAYIILFRNLWGKQGREKFAIKDDILLQWVFGVIAAPFVLPYMGAVASVKFCQKCMCGQQEEDVEDVELGITPSSARFPPEARKGVDDSKSEQEEGHEHVNEETLDNDVAETRGLLSGQEGTSLPQ